VPSVFSPVAVLADLGRVGELILLISVWIWLLSTVKFLKVPETVVDVRELAPKSSLESGSDQIEELQTKNVEIKVDLWLVR
jgi:hypothetical protein